MSKKPWKTVLIERQTLLRNLLAKMLRLTSQFELLAEVEDAVEGKAVCLQTRPDLVILDVSVGRMEDIVLAQQLIQQLPMSRILVLSEAKDSFTLYRLHQIGIHGFVEKDQSLEVVEEALVEVASGRNYFTATLCRNEEQLRLDTQAFSKILTAKEQQILWYVAKGWTSKAIARRLNMSHRTVETYRYRLMKKLEIDSMAGLIEFAYRTGFMLSEESALVLRQSTRETSQTEPWARSPPTK